MAGREEKQPYRDRAQQADKAEVEKLTKSARSAVARAFVAPVDGVVTFAQGSSAQKSMEVKVLTEVLLDETTELDSRLLWTVPVFCYDCAKVFELVTPPHTACPHCNHSVQSVEQTGAGNGLQDYLEVHLHKVSLVTSHRGASAPQSKDFRLVRLLDDPHALSQSLHQSQLAEAHGEPRRKRLRRMSPEDVAPDFDEGQDEPVEAAHVD
eukprot:s341_g11.t1